MIKGIVNSYFVIDQNLKLLLPLLNDESVYSVWDYGEGVDGVAAMRMALYSHILSDMRAIMFDHDKKVASIYNIISALKDNGAVQKFKSDFCQASGVKVCGEHTEEERQFLIDTLQKEDVERKSKLFDETLVKVITEYTTLKESDLGVRVDTARSKMISHKQITTIEGQRKLFDASDFGLKYKDAKDFVYASKDIIFGVNLLLLNSSYDLKGFLGHHDLVSKTFWGKFKNV